MEFRLLGPLAIASGGLDLTPARPKQRALLALLLLRAGKAITTDELIDALWGEQPPETAQTALHGHVSALRKRIGADRIVTEPRGYRLRLADDDFVDLHRFERLLEEARDLDPRARAERVAAALSLFRGEPLSDFRYDAFAGAAIARLEDLRLDAIEDKLDAELELGHHRDAIPQLEALIREHPERERLRGQLMVALYRAGRQADALRVFREARAALRDDLGIEPGLALRELERRILNHDPLLAAPHELAPPAPFRPPEHEGVVTFVSVRDIADARLARTILSQHGGDAAPDGLVAAFARARDAAVAAVAVLQATSARIGIASSDALRSERGYAGAGPRTAAAFSAAAHAGQILLSETTRDRLRETPLQPLEVHDLGSHRLRDLGPPRRLFQLAEADSPQSSQRPRSLETYTTNLPPQPTPLVGREREVADVCALLRRDDVRLVTLTGTGGIGKTRTAVHSAAELLDDFDDGVFFLDLAPLRRPDLVSSEVHRLIGDDRRARNLLLVLDNFEHLLPAAPAVAELLASRTRSKILVTSRSPLALDGEHTYAVPPLATPPKRGRGYEHLLQFDAVALFASRARALRDDFTLTPDSAAAVAGICRNLDGLPLAIELAAGRVGVLPPPVLLRRLNRKLSLLKRSGGAAPDRHRTLRATIDWSHALLQPDEQRLFARLAVFAGGWTLEAAEAICGHDLDAVDVLTALVAASLVRAERGDDEQRFTFLETTREYADERLHEAEDRDDVRRRHAEHFLAVAEDAEPDLREDPGEALARLEREHDNLRIALDHFDAVGDTERLSRLSGALWRFWYLGGHLREGRRRLERAVEIDPPPTARRAKALLGLTVLTGNSGDFAETRAHAEEALALNEELGDDWGVAYAKHMLGNTFFNEGELAPAEALFADSVALFRRVGDEHSALLVSRNLARLLEQRGDDDGARAVHARNLHAARETGNGRIEASTLGALAMLAAREGRTEDALVLLAASMRIHRSLHDLLDTAVDLCRSAFVLASSGREETAAVLLFNFDDVREDIGVRRSWVESINARTAELVENALGDRVSECRERAAGLTIDDAVALALAALPDPEIRPQAAYA